MTQFSTELLNFLAQKQDIDEFFRTSLETAMNDLLQAELSAFLGYEPYDKVGYNSGNSRNGTYSRKFETKYGTVQLSIPRDRNGNFTLALLPAYGHHCSPATISNISKATHFHERSLEANYSVLFFDGTYLRLRRGTVSKECIHIARGITPVGQKAVLGYEIAPNENNASWSTLLDKLQNQGIQQVSLVVTDGFKGLEQMISQAYPLAKQQRYLIHISRNLASKVKRSDRAVILEQFKTIYRAENLEMTVQALEDFIAEWKPKYQKIMESLENADNLLTFYQFPYQIWHSIYSTNLIESLNKEIKRKRRFFF